MAAMNIQGWISSKVTCNVTFCLEHLERNVNLHETLSICIVNEIINVSKNILRACLHRDGGPQVSEVTRLGGVKKYPSITCNLTTPPSRGALSQDY